MINFSFIVAGLLSAAQAASVGGGFPCEKLRDEGVRVFEGIGAPDAQPSAPVRLKKKALLARQRYPLTTRWLTLDDQALASEGGKFPAVPFRAFRIDGKTIFCTSAHRDSLFGPRTQDGNFLLRCLIDQNGDGRFESFRAHGELVAFNSRTGKSGEPTGAVPGVRPLPKPLALVESPAAKDPNPGFTPRIFSELRVAGVTDQAVTLQSMSHVAMLPGSFGERFRGSEDQETWTVPLREGSWTSPSGQTILFSRKGKDWYAALAGGAAASGATLQCGGSVVAIGDKFTIMSEGGMSVVRLNDLAGR
jgi:hypothetical protein